MARIWWIINIFFICIYIPKPAYADIVPLRDILAKTKNNAKRFELTREISKQYFSIPEHDSALYYIKEAALFAGSLGSKVHLAEVNIFEAQIQIYFEEYPEALKALKEASKNLNEIKSPNYLSRYYYFLACCYENFGSFDKAMEAALKAVKYAESTNDLTLKAFAFFRIASIHGLKSDSPHQRTNYKIAYDLFGQARNNNGEGLVNNALGVVYVRNNQYDSAASYFKRSYLYYSLAGNNLGLCDPLDNLATLYFKQQDLIESRRTAETLIVFGKRYSSPKVSSRGYYHLALGFQKEGKMAKALSANDSALMFSRQTKQKSLIADMLAERIDICANAGLYGEAYQINKEYAQIQNELFNLNAVRQIEMLQTEYDTEKKEKENLLLKADINQAETRNLLLFGFAGLLVLGLGLQWAYLGFRNKALKAEKSYNNLKNKLFSLLGHELRGPMASFGLVGGLIRHYADEGETDELLTLGHEIERSAHSLNFMLENLLNWSAGQLEEGKIAANITEIDPHTFLSEITTAAMPSAESKKITISLNITQNVVLYADINMLTIMVRNMLNNAIKFTGIGGNIRIVITENDSYKLISITDSGIGMSEIQLTDLLEGRKFSSRTGTSGEPGLGLGMQVVRNFAELMNFKLLGESEPDNGTTLVLQMPVIR